MKTEGLVALSEAVETANLVRQYESRQVAAKTMVGDLLGTLLDEIKQMPNVWQKTGEAQQGEIIERLTQQVELAVMTCVHIIASENRPAIEATLDQVTRKDSIKAVLIIPATIAQRHELSDACKQKVLIVLPDAEGYYGGKDGIRPDADQPSLPIHDHSGEA